MRILEGGQVFIHLVVARIETRHHKTETIATQTLPQKTSQIRVSVRNVGVSSPSLGDRNYDLPQRHQRLVDLDAFLKSSVATLKLALGSSEIDQLQS